MTPRLLGAYSADSPDWHQARRQRIGGSDVGVIMGWSHFQTRDELLALKRGEAQPKKATAAMQRGNYLEAGVRDWFCHESGIAMESTGATFVHSEHDWALANVDAFLADGSILEVKTAKEKTADHGWGRAGTNQIPLTYASQIQWYLGVCERPLAHVAVLFGAPFGFYRYKVTADADAFAYLLHHAALFRAEMTAPNPDTQESAA